MENSEKLATLNTQDEDKKKIYKTKTKNTTQKTKKMSNTVPTGGKPGRPYKKNYIFFLNIMLQLKENVTNQCECSLRNIIVVYVISKHSFHCIKLQLVTSKNHFVHNCTCICTSIITIVHMYSLS